MEFNFLELKFQNCVLGIALNLQEPKKTKEYKSTSLSRKINIEFEKILQELKHIKWKKIWYTFFLKFLFGLSISVYFSNQTFYIQDKFNLTQRYVGYTISFLSIFGVITSFLSGKIKNVFYKNDTSCLKRLFHAFTLLSICFLALFFSTHLYMFLVFLVPFSFASSILRNVSTELILLQSDHNEKGSLSGVSNSVMSISRSVAPIFAGFIADKFGRDSVIVSGFVPSFLGSIFCIYLTWKRD